MKTKKCFKCLRDKDLSEFYKQSSMKDGHLNKCKVCTREDNKTSNGSQKRTCIQCSKPFRTTLTEVKRGRGVFCSWSCYKLGASKRLKHGSESPNWKGNKVSVGALHDWVRLHLGTPKICEACKKEVENPKAIHWANKSQEYKRELDDWMRLCTKCHARYDRPAKFPKWKKSVEKLGWKITKTV